MSDPVTNVEIEDVLSSIRRLVSDEDRTSRKEFDAAQAQPETRDCDSAPDENVSSIEDASPDETQGSGTPALILTPALRIADDVAEVATPDSVPLDFADHVEDAIAALHEDAAPEDIAPADDAPSEDQPDETSAAFDVEEADVWVAESDEDGAGPAEPDAPSSDVFDHADSPYTETLGDPEYAADAMEEDAHLETGQDTDLPPFLLQNAAHVEADTADTADPQLDGDEDSPPQTLVDVSNGDRSIEDKIAALEALIGPSNAGFEAEASETQQGIARVTRLPWPTDVSDLPQADASDLPDPAEASQTADIDAESAAFEAAHAAAIDAVEADLHQNAVELDTDLEAASVIDEEALRDMVADIVRQELQGPLGERITRNVRKLVRREIYRAMAANELD